MPTLDYKASLDKCKLLAIKAAKELYYGPEVIKEIEKAESERRITYIMNKARHDVIDRDRYKAWARKRKVG